MAKKRKIKNKSKKWKTALDRSPACSDARLGDWEKLTSRAFYTLLDCHKHSLVIKLSNYYDEGFNLWMSMAVYTSSDKGKFINGEYPYKLSWRTTIFQ